MKILLSVAALALLATSVPAKSVPLPLPRPIAACVANLVQGLADREYAEYICQPGMLVKPPERGWHCVKNGKTRFKAPGGTRLKRDADCGEDS